MERAMGFEPTTSCLGSKHSTTELRPLEAEGSPPNILQSSRNSKTRWTDTYSSVCRSAIRLSCTPAQYCAHSSRVARSVLPET